MSARFRSVSSRLDGSDLLLVGAVVAVSIVQWVAHDAKGTGLNALPPWLAALLTVVSAGLVLGAPRWPLFTLAASASVSVAIAAVDYIPIGLPIVAIVTLYLVGLHGYRSRTLVVGLAIALTALVVNAILSDDRLLSLAAFGQLALILCPLALGDAVRSRRAYVAELLERVDQAERAREEEAQRRAEQERLRIARELHDVVAHTITTVNVQAGVALHLFDDDPAHARASLVAIKETSHEALDELRGLLGVLRNGDGAGEPLLEPAPDLVAVDKLVDEARTSGLDVDLEVVGDPPLRIPEAVQLAGYRIVQEALTNVLRHAGQVPMSVRLAYAADRLQIVCRNTAPAAGPLAGAGAGVGIIGMEERATALGGRVESGPTPDGGFQVLAEIPYRRLA